MWVVANGLESMNLQLESIAAELVPSLEPEMEKYIHESDTTLSSTAGPKKGKVTLDLRSTMHRRLCWGLINPT